MNHSLYTDIENLLLSAAKGENTSWCNEIITTMYFKDDLVEPELYTEFSMLKNAMEGADYSLAALKEKMCTYKAFFPQVTRLVHLLLVIPATSATAERSFSSLRKIKTYLRTTMKQERLK